MPDLDEKRPARRIALGLCGFLGGAALMAVPSDMAAAQQDTTTSTSQDTSTLPALPAPPAQASPFAAPPAPTMASPMIAAPPSVPAAAPAPVVESAPPPRGPLFEVEPAMGRGSVTQVYGAAAGAVVGQTAPGGPGPPSGPAQGTAIAPPK